MSKYDEIFTAYDLIREVISNGLSTAIEDINRAADIFGNSSVDELAKLANSEDQICGKYVSNMFYSIAFSIWNWQDAVNFYNEHTNLAGVKLREARATIDSYIKENADVQEALNESAGREEEFRLKWREQECRAIKTEEALDAAYAEIVALKAKLYDLLTADK